MPLAEAGTYFAEGVDVGVAEGDAEALEADGELLGVGLPPWQPESKRPAPTKAATTRPRAVEKERAVIEIPSEFI
ncbi:hypothetical protein [Arthrobacter cupressi]